MHAASYKHAILSQATTLLAHPCASREGEDSPPFVKPFFLCVGLLS
jgi:hypothetical protein